MGPGFAGATSFVLFPFFDLAIVDEGLTEDVRITATVPWVLSSVGLSSGISAVSDRAGPSLSVFSVLDCTGWDGGASRASERTGSSGGISNISGGAGFLCSRKGSSDDSWAGCGRGSSRISGCTASSEDSISGVSDFSSSDGSRARLSLRDVNETIT